MSDAMQVLMRRMAAAGDLTVHYVRQRPTDREDASGVLCVRSGEAKVKPLAEGATPQHAWTVNAADVTCKRCLEWMHA